MACFPRNFIQLNDSTRFTSLADNLEQQQPQPVQACDCACMPLSVNAMLAAMPRASCMHDTCVDCNQQGSVPPSAVCWCMAINRAACPLWCVLVYGHQQGSVPPLVCTGAWPSTGQRAPSGAWPSTGQRAPLTLSQTQLPFNPMHVCCKQ